MLLLRAGCKRAFVACFLSVGAVAILGACSALVGFDGFVGGGGTDAGEDSLARDAAADTSPAPTDGGTPFDAAAASDASDASRIPFCASLTTTPTFCDDFERDSGVKGSWTQAVTAGPGALLVLAADSQGQYAHAEVGGGGQAHRQADLQLDVPPSTSKLTARWKLRVQANTASDLYSEVLSLTTTGSAQGFRQVVFAVQDVSSSDFNGASGFEDGGPGPTFTMSTSFPRGSWQDVAVTFDFQVGTAVLTIDAMPPVMASIPLLFTATSMSIRFGVDYIGTNGPAIAPLAVDVDDVAVTYE